MDDYNFIKRCKNYNIKNSKGIKYETIIKRSINKIKKLEKELNKLDSHCFHDLWVLGWNGHYKVWVDHCFYYIKNGDKYIISRHTSYRLKNYEVKKERSPILLKEFNMEITKEKLKMCIHKIKLSLPDHLIYEIGIFF